MGINLNEISQKVLDNNTNASNVFRKMYDLHYNPNPLDVPFEYIDENGNKTTTNIANIANFRKKVWDDVGGALGQFSRTFYVDAENGNDNNDGSSGSPFKTAVKALNSGSVGGMVKIYLKTGQTHYIDSNVSVYNKYIYIYKYGSDNTPVLFFKEYTYGGKYCFYKIRAINSTILIYGIDVKIDNTDDGDASSENTLVFTGKGSSFNFMYINFYLQDRQYTRILGEFYGPNILNISFILCNIYLTTDKDQYVVNLSGSDSSYGTLNLVWRKTTLTDQDGNSLDIKDYVTGIVKDSDSGNPVNVISNINFSS